MTYAAATPTIGMTSKVTTIGDSGLEIFYYNRKVVGSSPQTHKSTNGGFFLHTRIPGSGFHQDDITLLHL